MIAIGIEQKVANLELKLAEALDRITQLEQRQPTGCSAILPAEERQLLPLDSPWSEGDTATRQLVSRDSDEMAHALQLCQDVFPGCTVEVEVLCDPSEPDWPWYLLIVHLQGEVRDSIDRQLRWQEKMTTAFPAVFDEFRIFVDLQ